MTFENWRGGHARLVSACCRCAEQQQRAEEAVSTAAQRGMCLSAVVANRGRVWRPA